LKSKKADESFTTTTAAADAPEIHEPFSVQQERQKQQHVALRQQTFADRATVLNARELMNR
jgi:hypothetical protein